MPADGPPQAIAEDAAGQISQREEPFRSDVTYDRHCLIFDLPLWIELGWYLHPQRTVWGLLVAVRNPPRDLPYHCFQNLWIRLIQLIPLEATEEHLGLPV